MVSSLSHLCASRIGNICREGRIDISRLLRKWTLPDDVAHQILLKLPLNQLITLDDEDLGYVDAFSKTWKTLCTKCANSSTAFRKKLTQALAPGVESLANIKNAEVDFHEETSKEFDSNIDPKLEKNTRRDILLNSLFQELIEICMHKRSRHTRCQPVYLLCEALAEHMYEITDQEMFLVLSHQVTKCNVYSRQVAFLQESMVVMDNFFKKLLEVAFVITDGTSKDKWADFFTMLQKRIHISTLSLCSCNASETIVHLLTANNSKSYGCMSPKRPKLSSLWDEAVADAVLCTEPQESNIENDIYDGMLLPPTMQKRCSFDHIANLHIDLSDDGDTTDWQRLSAALSSWTLLESVKMVFPKHILAKDNENAADQQKHGDQFAHGILKLCSSGGSRLRSLSLVYGVWRCKSIRTLAYGISRKHVPCRHFEFDGCAVLPPEGNVSEAPYETEVAILNMREIVFVDNKTCLKILPLFLKVFNPMHITITSAKGSWTRIDPMLEQLTQIWRSGQMSKCKVSHITTEIEPHLSHEATESMLRAWISTKSQYFSGIDFTIYHYTNLDGSLHERLCGDGVTFVKLEGCPESQASVVDYVAVM